MAYRCTGRGAASESDCRLEVPDMNSALDHYEQADHDLEELESNGQPVSNREDWPVE